MSDSLGSGVTHAALYSVFGGGGTTEQRGCQCKTATVAAPLTLLCHNASMKVPNIVLAKSPWMALHTWIVLCSIWWGWFIALNASSFLPFSATSLCKVQMQKLGCGGLKLGQRCVSLFRVKVSCLGMALMVVSFCVFSVSMLV